MSREADQVDAQINGTDTGAAPYGTNPALGRCLAYLVIIAYVTLSLLPLLSSGFYSDDLVHSTLKGQIGLQNSSVLKHIIDTSKHWIINNGRFFPVSAFSVFYAAYFLHNVILYKMSLLVMVIINVVIFGLLIENITSNRYISYVSMLLVPLMFQFRLYHDPILSHYGLMQLFILLILCSLLLFNKYLHSQEKKYLLISVVLFNLVLYLYEISILLIVLYVIMLLSRHGQEKYSVIVKKLLPFAVSVLVAIASMLLVRLFKNTSSPEYSGILLSLNTASIVQSMLVQLYATLPLSYYISNPSHLFHLTVSDFLGNIKLLDIAGIIVLVSSYLYAVKNIKAVYKDCHGRMMAFLGFMLVICPAFMISLSEKYQKELYFGVGYIQVYIQYYGLALISMALILYAHHKLAAKTKQSLLHAGLLVVFSVIFMLNAQNNRLVIEKSNIDMHYRRSALITSFDENILGNVPENSVIFIKDEYDFDLYPQVIADTRGWAEYGYPWKNAALVYMYAKKKMNVVTEVNQLKQYTAGGAEIYLLTVKSFPISSGNREGFVILSKIENLHQDADGNVRFQSQPLETRFPKEKG